MALLVTIGAAIRMAMEEALLRERYPEYAIYAKRTKRVIPFVL
jgi:protein-S-isoprenylcysteine O-methyltransferase Ste14